ncbi:uncharacterized protein LOC109841877 [Asparagus officinalis]|uniref:uncharacterized protein LOC109841877 n=1 Tax=Asparagus officinalis TaxID=4686 RepID=UPI00098E4034|nr:uncharacterized protein LOC109841877 [Asparagus officinalis]
MVLLRIIQFGYITEKSYVAPNIADNEEEDNEENLFPEEEMEEMIEVAFGDSNLAEDDHPSGQEHVDEYEKYMKDAKRPIYENAKYSTLSWFVQLFQIKCLNKWSNKSFTMLLKFLKDSMPLGNNVPQSWYEAKRIMSDLGLNCEKIHACPNDCVLFWKENSKLKECPNCGVSRYKKKAHANKNDIPVKVVRYFPVTQRLQRLYRCKKTAVAMTWHDRAIPSEHETYDTDKGETFTMRAALMWTINDFPAYGMLSGYSVHGYKTCPYCHADTSSTWLPFSKKICYCGHRRMLEEDHPYRDDAVHFDGTTEHRKAPVPLSGKDILAQWNVYGNITFGKVKERQERPQGWNKKNGKSKDNLQARRDLHHFNIRKELHPVPKAGFSGSFNKKIKTVKGKIDGLKSHDHHVIMQHLLPLSLRTSLPESVGLVINELCTFFRELCAKNVDDKELEKLEKAIPLILCKLERIFPPSFFDIIIHLIVHLAKEARLVGPVQYRWMYPIEKYLLTLKNYIRNRNRPEGSIMEETKLNRPVSIHDGTYGKLTYTTMGLTFINDIHRFIILNSICLEEVREIHKDELREEHPNWNVERLEKHHHDNFVAGL